MAQYGAETAFRRTLPFSEKAILIELHSYLKKTLDLENAEIMSVEEARQKGGCNSGIIDGSEPGSPAFEYYNV
jgi:leucyl-tRNA synthetase